MESLTRFRLWLRSVLLRRRMDRDMREEMGSHLEQSVSRLVARGMTAESARRAAGREFGNLDVLQEQARDARGGRWIESVVQDLRFGMRHFARTPLSTVTMVVLLALGIGFNTVLFTVIYSFVSMPPPGIARDASLVRIRGLDRSLVAGRTYARNASYPEYLEYAAQRSVFAAVAAWSASEVALDVGETEAQLLSAAARYVTPNYFEVLGVRPHLGPGLPAAGVGDGSPHVAVISHALWRRHFSRSPDVIGRTVKLNEVPVTIVGVAPPRFLGATTWGTEHRLWLPLYARAAVQRGSASALASHDSAFLGMAARLQPDVSVEQANAVVQAIAARSALGTPRWSAPDAASADVAPMRADNHTPPSGEPPQIAGRVMSLFIPLLILLIPCTNVSALLVGLAIARRREIAVRLSLGAARRRLVRQLLTESVLLSLAAAALGLFVIWIGLKVFAARFPSLALALHPPAFAFAFGIAILTGLLFGVSPALHATRLAVADILKDAAVAVASARSRLQSGLVIGLIAMTQPLLLMMGVFVLEVLGDLRAQPSSPFSDRILDVRFNRDRSTPADEESLMRLQARFSGLPGIETVMLRRTGGWAEVTLSAAGNTAGEAARSLSFSLESAPPGYLEMMGIPVVRGRSFHAADREEEGGIVIGRDLARRVWGTADPIGRRLARVAGTSRATEFVVIGVVDETIAGESDANIQSRAYVADLAGPSRLLIRTRGPASPVAPLIRATAAAEAPQLPLTSATTLAALEASSRRVLLAAASGAIGGGVIALFLSAIGLYAIVAFAVSQRTREIGIRTAMGADPQRVVRMFFLRGLRVSLIGLATGLALSVLAVRAVALSEGEPPVRGLALIAALVVTLVVAVACVATWVPARRAAGIDPLNALRAE